MCFKNTITIVNILTLRNLNTFILKICYLNLNRFTSLIINYGMIYNSWVTDICITLHLLGFYVKNVECNCMAILYTIQIHKSYIYAYF